MEIFQPWKIEIARFNIADLVDLAGLSEEIFQLHCASPRESKIPYDVTPEEFPLICALRDGTIIELAKEYIQHCFNIDPQKVEIDTFGKWFQEGEELNSHLHGNSCVTSVFYPADYKSGIMINDPRFNASRGYSRRVRDSHFGELTLSPKAGDLIMMPSYLMHSVPVVTENLRVSLINDFHFV